MENKPQIIYEDKNLLALNKPYGLTVNNSDTTKGQITLQDWLNQEYPFFHAQASKEDEKEFFSRSGIVHRLDKDTSGIILIAKNPASFFVLQNQFKERLVKKTYLALVWGKLSQSGEVNAPITRNPFNRSRFGVYVGGKEAYTSYKMIKTVEINKSDMALLEVSPTTGRTHQIRVHLNYIGHPIVGDPLYSGREKSREGLKIFGRLMLHAYEINFFKPDSNEKLTLKTGIPMEFQQFYKKLD